MNNDFLRAAASYYGMNPDTAATDWQNDGGAMLFTFSIHATEDDMAGILARMKVMREEEAHTLTRPAKTVNDLPTDSQMRSEYNAMDKHQRSRYGSFSVYKTARIMGAMPDLTEGSANLNRKVEHINAPEESEPVIMDAVWLIESETSEAQKIFASDVRQHEGCHREYLIQWAMLTEEQKNKAKMVKCGRCEGTGFVGVGIAGFEKCPDCGGECLVTSNADDFGGLPG